MKPEETTRGDIVARITNFNERYVVTAVTNYGNKPVWRGINERGGDQGCTIFGSWHWEQFAKVGHIDLSIIDKVKFDDRDYSTIITADRDEVEIHKCPNEVWRWVVARKHKDKWYYWADFRKQSEAERVADDIRGYGESHDDYDGEVAVFSADYRWIKEDISSHSERDILEGCIALMRELNDRFLDYLDFMDIEPGEDEQWKTYFSYFEIVQRLFLWHTKHSGGTCTRLKISELGYHDPNDVVFEDDRNEEEND